MHYEYAVEPEAISSSWQEFKYLIEKFGYEKGRLISKFPRKWEKRVVQLVYQSDISVISKKRIIEKLKSSSRNALIDSRQSSTMQSNDWLEAAIIEDQVSPFRGILARQDQSGSDRVIETDYAIEEHELFFVDPSTFIPRTVEAIARATRYLLENAKYVEIIDPYFQPFGDGYRPMLLAIIEFLRPQANGECILKIHRRFKAGEEPTEAECANLNDVYVNTLPQGWRIEVYYWEDLREDEDFHDRHLLTNNGGVSLGAGFEVVGEHQHVNLSFLSIDNCNQLSRRFGTENGCYQLGCNILRITSEGVSLEL